MQVQSVFLLILAAIIALGIVYFQYFHKIKTKARWHYLLATLRFIAIFGFLLILINPKMTKEEVSLEKRNLLILKDLSSSIDNPLSAQQLSDALSAFETSTLGEKFRLQNYGFSDVLVTTDTSNNNRGITNISEALNSLNEIYNKEDAVVVLLSDGNQTYGTDYVFIGNRLNYPVFPLVLGDTTKYEDLRIDQVNLNKYAFLNNKFPVETLLSYQGNDPVSQRFKVFVDSREVHSEIVSFDASNNSKTLSTAIDATAVGVKKIRVEITPLQAERNTDNNSKTEVIEIIDEKTTIAIVTDILHPDIGALTKSIEANEQRSVEVLSPTAPRETLEDIDLFILYQPTSRFRSLYQFMEQKRVNRFTITGPKTDWNFLNSIQNTFEKNYADLSDEIVPILNSGFSTFSIDDFQPTEYPPLEGILGDVLIPQAFEAILGQQLRGVDLGEPLLAVTNKDQVREAVLFGENVWKWRSQAFRNDQNFDSFDNLLGKILLYLSSDTAKERLSLDYENSYQGSANARIRASYFDQTFVFDRNANLTIDVHGINGDFSRKSPLLLKRSYYEADLSDLPPGDYSFTVSVANDQITRSGSFSILDFDVEQQLLSSDAPKLKNLASISGGKLYYPSQTDSLIADLLSERAFLPRQISKQNVVSLIDFKIVLFLLVMSLAAEWFIRKYHGLI